MMRIVSVLFLTCALSAQPISIGGPPLVGFSNIGTGTAADDLPAVPPSAACSASMAVVPSSAPLTVSKRKVSDPSFFIIAGNCGHVTPKGCSFSGSLRVNNGSVREIEVCPPGVQAGNRLCVKIPAGGWFRFIGINIQLTCSPSGPEKESMSFTYFDGRGGQMKTGEIEFVCGKCK